MSDDAIRRAAAFAAAHLGEDISVPDIADHLGYSPFHFTRMFTAGVRVPPGRYLAALRFHAAKSLLLSGTDPVVDVCAQVGFASLSSFSRRFRAAVGTSPAQFRVLADRVAESVPVPFALGERRAGQVSVEIRRPPAGLRVAPLVWIGWFPAPVPIGLPRAGVLVRGAERVRLPLCAGAPWLLGFCVDAAAEVVEHLAPPHPLVASHPAPLTAPAHVTLAFGRASGPSVPLLAALPSLQAPA